MTQTYKHSSQGSSEKSPSSHSKQVLHHVLKNVMKIRNDEKVPFSKWMEYMAYDNVIDLCDDLQFELKHIHNLSDNIVDEQYCALKFATMNKTKLFISWMSSRMKNKTIQLSSELSTFLPLPMNISITSASAHIRMTEVPTAPTPSPTI